jgi:hypothetical protein
MTKLQKKYQHPSNRYLRQPLQKVVAHGCEPEGNKKDLLTNS